MKYLKLIKESFSAKVRLKIWQAIIVYGLMALAYTMLIVCYLMQKIYPALIGFIAITLSGKLAMKWDMENRDM